MFFKTEMSRSSVVIILLIFGLQNKNVIESLPNNLQAESSISPPIEQLSTNGVITPKNVEEVSSQASTAEITQMMSNPMNSLDNPTTVLINRQNHDDDFFSNINNNSKEVGITSQKRELMGEHQSLQHADVQSNKPRKLVAEIIDSIPYNNSYVLTTLLNFSFDKQEISHIGEPFDLSFIKDLKFDIQSISYNNKTTNFSNIHASGVSGEPVDMFYNNFSCTSQRIRMVLNVIPENMTFEGDYAIQDNLANKISNGSFLFNQTEAKLSYDLPTISVLHHNSHNLTGYGDVIYANGQVKFTQLCDKQCDLLASSATMFDGVKSYILEKLNSALISKKFHQFVSAFPFLSICTSPLLDRPKSNNIYVIEEQVLKTYKSSNLLLGPMILKGFDDFTSGNVIAVKSGLPRTPSRFLLTTRTNHIQGQCDWRYFKGNNDRNSNNKHSFTFIVEGVKFNVGVNFSESWNMDDLEIDFGKITIHRLDKQHPKMLDFVKFVLEDFVRVAVIDSLKGIFRVQFPELMTSTSTSATQTAINRQIKTTETRQVVYWSTLRSRNPTDATANDNDHLPFPTRRVLTPCKDTRKWWQKIFYRNKCKRNTNDDVN